MPVARLQSPQALVINLFKDINMTRIDTSIYITDVIRKNFKPTFLYIKQHKITGKMYFGKTSKPWPIVERYLGSGSYWRNHINKHGKEHVSTVWYCLFYDIDDLVDFAVSFSLVNDIVKSDNWANMILESGIDNRLGVSAPPYTTEYIQRQKESHSGKMTFIENETGEYKIITTEEYRNNKDKYTPLMTGKKQSETHIRNRSIALSSVMKGITQSEESKFKKSLSNKGMVTVFDLVNHVDVRMTCDEFNNIKEIGRYVGLTSRYAKPYRTPKYKS